MISDWTSMAELRAMGDLGVGRVMGVPSLGYIRRITSERAISKGAAKDLSAHTHMKWQYEQGGQGLPTRRRHRSDIHRRALKLLFHSRNCRAPCHTYESSMVGQSPLLLCLVRCSTGAELSKVVHAGPATDRSQRPDTSSLFLLAYCPRLR